MAESGEEIAAAAAEERPAGSEQPPARKRKQSGTDYATTRDRKACQEGSWKGYMEALLSESEPVESESESESESVETL